MDLRMINLNPLLKRCVKNERGKYVLFGNFRLAIKKFIISGLFFSKGNELNTGATLWMYRQCGQREVCMYNIFSTNQFVREFTT